MDNFNKNELGDLDTSKTRTTNNQNNEVIDLSNVSKQNVKNEFKQKPTSTIRKNKRLIYIIIILISWLVIVSVVASTIISNENKKAQREKAIQEVELKLQQNANK